MSAIEQAERAGFDSTLIDANLSYSYEKRVLLHDAALALALEMEAAGRKLRGEPQSITTDLLSSVLGVGDFERVRAGSVEIEVFGRRCRVISLEDLIQAKEALSRDKDVLAAKELRAIREKLKAAQAAAAGPAPPSSDPP